jgi:hypothetical protein
MKKTQVPALAQKIVAMLVRYGFLPGTRYPRAVVVDAINSALEAEFPLPASPEAFTNHAQVELPLAVPRVRGQCSPLIRARSIEKRSRSTMDRKKPVPAERLNEAAVTCAHIMLLAGHSSLRYDDSLKRVRQIVVEAVHLLGYTTEYDDAAVAWPIVKHWSVLARDDGADDDELLAAAKWWQEHPTFRPRASREAQSELLLAAS